MVASSFEFQICNWPVLSNSLNPEQKLSTETIKEGNISSVAEKIKLSRRLKGCCGA